MTDRKALIRNGLRVSSLGCVAAVLLGGCAITQPAPTAIECAPLPDARQTLAQAWQAYQPDQPMPFSIPVRRGLFAFQVLLISAGMYDDPPADPTTVDAQYAPDFVRDFGMGRNPGLKDAFAKLSQALEQARDRSEADLGANCGFILARRMLRADPVNVSTDWVLQAVTWGFAATFQESIRQLVGQAAQACSAEPDTAGVAEAILVCTARRVGL